MTKLEEEIFNKIQEVDSQSPFRDMAIAAAEVAKRYIDRYDEALMNHILKFREQFCNEDEHGNWSIKEDKQKEFGAVEDLLDDLNDFGIAWLKDNGVI